MIVEEINNREDEFGVNVLAIDSIHPSPSNHNLFPRSVDGKYVPKMDYFENSSKLSSYQFL